MATFELELVSPERLLLSRAVEMVILPAAEGEMGVLAGHSPMIVALRGGTIRVRDRADADADTLFVAGGFAEVTPTRVTVLADEAVPVGELSRAEADRRVAEAEKGYAQAAVDAPERREAAMGRLLAMRAMREAARAP
jgi:F-type H+-transporting ATPase subunit epsilon